MSRIRGTDTKIEQAIRKGLHILGLRYRLGGAGLPGKPDLVFPRYRTVVFVHGCFWHGHDCHLFRLPKTRTEFWRQKIEGNRERDARVIRNLEAAGWRVLVVWECGWRGQPATARDALVRRLADEVKQGTAGDDDARADEPG